MRTGEVFAEFEARRKGILRALTTDVDAFYAQCDPERENLCLYGLDDGTWSVDLPTEEVPPEIPEPALGINFARDGMQKRDWLSLVAVHSDSWLLGLAFYKGARLNREQRDELFRLINALPTCYEVVSGKARAAAGGVAGASGGAGGAARGPRPVGRPPKRRAPAADDDDDEDDDDDADDGWRDGDGDPCPACGRFYRTDEFWIACDTCDTWYCGRCAKMTASKAEKARSWKCPKH